MGVRPPTSPVRWNCAACFSGVRPRDHDPNDDVAQPTWDPGDLDDEERVQLEALLLKLVAKQASKALP